MYLALEDLVDNFGHGTHVAGTLAGASYLTLGAQTPDVATGMAPGAKVAFIDLSRDNSDSVWTPGDLTTNYFDFSYRWAAVAAGLRRGCGAVPRPVPPACCHLHGPAGRCCRAPLLPGAPAQRPRACWRSSTSRRSTSSGLGLPEAWAPL
jgi:hypothetical protein